MGILAGPAGIDQPDGRPVGMRGAKQDVCIFSGGLADMGVMLAHDFEGGPFLLIPASAADVVEIEFQIGEPARHSMADAVGNVGFGERVRRVDPAGFVRAASRFLFESLAPDGFQVGGILEPWRVAPDHGHGHPQSRPGACRGNLLGIERQALGEFRIRVPHAVDILVTIVDLDGARPQAVGSLHHRGDQTEDILPCDFRSLQIPAAPAGQGAFFGARVVGLCDPVGLPRQGGVRFLHQQDRLLAPTRLARVDLHTAHVRDDVERDPPFPCIGDARFQISDRLTHRSEQEAHTIMAIAGSGFLHLQRCLERIQRTHGAPGLVLEIAYEAGDQPVGGIAFDRNARWTDSRFGVA